MSERFNYIVPIFNKEDVLPKTLEGIERCARGDDRIFCIVDGCTDRSEDIVDEYIKNSSFTAEKILMPNVHMLLSVNEGLKRVTRGYSIIMQDDIILKDSDTEKKLLDLYECKQGKLGVLSLRYASNIGISHFKNRIKSKTIRGMIEEVDVIQGPDDFGNYPKGEYGNFYPRMSAINGPNCIPWDIVSRIGLFDENLAPFGFDDPEYCLRVLKKGFINGLYPIKYLSDEDWGGTRRSKTFIKYAKKIHLRNRKYIYTKHKKFLKKYIKSEKTYKDLEVG